MYSGVFVCMYAQTVPGQVHICEHGCVRRSVFMFLVHSTPAIESAAVPSGVCFEVVPGIRSQGGANPGRSLPW